MGEQIFKTTSNQQIDWRNKRGMIMSTNTIKKTDVISRNSYMFCEFGSACRFNYNKDQKCYGQHYVYNLVYFDILDILKYIGLIDLNDKLTKNDNQKSEALAMCTSSIGWSDRLHLSIAQNPLSGGDKYIQEIKTSVNTVTYVINHMYDELSHVKVINPKIYKEYEKKTIKFKSTVNIKF